MTTGIRGLSGELSMILIHTMRLALFGDSDSESNSNSRDRDDNGDLDNKSEQEDREHRNVWD